MNCTKCGKEIEEGENKVCEECRAKLVTEIQESEEVITDGEPKKKKRAKKEKKEIETKEVKTDVEETKETKESIYSSSYNICYWIYCRSSCWNNFK